MSILYTYHSDREFEVSIIELQKTGKTNSLENWLQKQQEIVNTDQINEILTQTFMISDSLFMPGASHGLALAINKCIPKEYIESLGVSPICQEVWSEHPNDFLALFNAYEKSFCNEQANLYSADRSLTTAAEHFIHQKLHKENGFWRAIYEFHRICCDKDTNFYIADNINIWLEKVPLAKQFIKDYSTDDEINFAQVAYIYLNHGLEINQNILKLYVDEPPKKNDIFEKAAHYYYLNKNINKKIVTHKKQYKNKL